MRLLRSALFNLIMYGSAIVLSAWVNMNGRRGPLYALGVGQAWSRLTLTALRVICKIDIAPTGLEHLPGSGGFLIAAQHQSAADILIWLTLLPRATYVLKQELLNIPLFGGALRHANMIPVDRGGGGRTLHKMVERCRAALAEGRQIVIFPEGTRIAPHRRGQLHPGVVALAKSLGTDIFPAATNSGTFWGNKAFTKTPGSIRIQVQPAIPHSLTRAQIIGQLERCFYQT